MKTIIVTGSAGSLGKAIVNKFIKEGYRVVGTVTHKENDEKNFSADHYEQVVVDVSNEDQAKQFIDDTVSKYGFIDAAVLTVGGFAQGTIAETTASQVVKQFNINFETTYNIAQPVFKQMIQQNGGRIFLTGSRPGIDAKSSKGMVAYGLAKSLLFRLAELMNDEGGVHNVVTSVVVPSTINTPINQKIFPTANFDNWVKPEAIADVVFFYCSDAAAVLREPVIKVYGRS